MNMKISADDAMALNEAVKYHEDQAFCPRDQFGNSSNHPNPRLQEFHSRVAEAIKNVLAACQVPPNNQGNRTNPRSG